MLVSGAGKSRTRLLIVIGTAAALLGAFVSVSGSTGSLIPVVVIAAVRAGIAPSKMLMPLAFLATGGSLLALTATPVNILASHAAADAGGRELGFFEFALVGLPLVVLTMVIVIVLGDKLLPERTPDSFAVADPSEHARTFRSNYQVDATTTTLFTAHEGVAEVLVAPRSELIGQDVSPGMTTSQEDVIIIGLRRGDAPPVGTVAEEKASDSLTLRAGDAMLVQGPWDALTQYVASPDVIAVTPPQTVRRAIPLGRGWKRVAVIFVAMVVLLATGVVPAAVATLLAAGALVVSGS